MKKSALLVVVLGLCIGVHAQISVGLTGTAVTNTFDASTNLPASQWASSLGVGANSSSYLTAADVAAAVQTLNQNSVTNPLSRITGDFLSEDARHNIAGGYLVTQPSGEGACLLKATLRNTSGQPISYLTVNYNFGVVSNSVTESTPGQEVFFSTNGLPGSWQRIAQFSGLNAAAFVSAQLFVGTWLPNADIYLLWADDNANNNPDGAYSIDNFYVNDVVLANNDVCSGAIGLTNGIVYSMNTANATSDLDVPSSTCGSLGKGVWFTFGLPTNGTIMISTCGSDFDSVLQVYTGTCGNLTTLFGGCNDDNGPACFTTQASLRFSAVAGVTYRILAGGYSGASGYLSIVATAVPPPCESPGVPTGDVQSVTTEAGGVRVYYQAMASGTAPLNFSWTFYSSVGAILFTDNGQFVSHLFGPFDEFPASYAIQVSNGCIPSGNNGSGGLPTCGAFCLSVGIPQTTTGTNGSGVNASMANPCSIPGTGSRWFQISTLTNATGTAMVSTEGSTYDTVLGAYRGSFSTPGALVPVTCNDNMAPGKSNSLVRFETRPGTNFWIVVNPPPAGRTLKLTYGYEVKIDSLAYNKTNRTLDLRSMPVASLPYQYKVLATTNLTNNAASWSLLLTTNFTVANPASNNIVRYADTNPPASTRRFYKIQRLP